MRNRNITLVAVSFIFVVCGCHDLTDTGAPVGTILSTPSAHPAPDTTPHTIQSVPENTPNWMADAAVVSVTSGHAQPCGWGTTPGAARSGVEWRIAVTADSILLDEDVRNWPTDDIPYSGHLDGAQFATSYKSASDYADYTCQFREATLTGRLTSDSTFDAVETLVWGTPVNQTTVVRHWKGSRL